MPKPDEDAPEREPLSVDQAVEMLVGPQADGDEDPAPEPDADGDDQDADDCAAPPFWSDEDKAAFADLPAPLQAKVAAYETSRHVAVARVLHAVATAHGRAQASAAEAGDLAGRLSAIVPQMEAAFAGRWGGREPNWAQVAQLHGPQAALQLKAAFDQDQAHRRLVQAANQEAQARHQAQHLRGEHQTLQVLEPELVHPQRGGARRTAVVRFLAANGVPPERIANIGAKELALAYDALRYRTANHALARPNRAAAVRPSLAPAAAQAVRSTEARKAEASKTRFAKRPSIDNAIAAILAKR